MFDGDAYQYSIISKKAANVQKRALLCNFLRVLVNGKKKFGFFLSFLSAILCILALSIVVENLI